jgi:hypothetical protein
VHLVAGERATKRRPREVLAYLALRLRKVVTPLPRQGPCLGRTGRRLSILAYNVARSFQLDTIATPRRRSRKRRYGYVLRSMRTLRFLLITRAGRLTRIGGNVLRLAQNPATETLYARIHHALAA